MTVRNKVGAVGTLAQEAVSTAFSIARHPIGSAALAAGLVKGATEASVDLVRSTITGRTPEPTERTERTEPTGPAQTTATETTTQAPSPIAVVPEADDPRDDLPGPDVFAPEVPTPDELPEPIVIEAHDPLGEAVHTEPKAASRDSDHGGLAGDREEIEGYVEEIPEAVEQTPVWTSESGDDEPVLDSAEAKALRAEAEMLRKGADLRVE